MPSKKPSPVPKSSSARLQPIRATQHFQLIQGSPATTPRSSSPTSRTTTDTRVTAVRNRWPSDHRSSPDRSDRKSPNSPSVKVSNRRSPSPSIRKTSSLDSIVAGPYLTGQWPRDILTSAYQHVMRDKTTQTSDSDWSSENLNKPMQMKTSNKSSRSSIADPDFKQMRKQLRTIAKRSSDKKARSPPVHGNHAALHQLPSHPRSNPIAIGNQAFGRIPRRQNSNEALNKEIEFISNSSSISGEPRHLQGVTPPDGHRAPFPRCSTRTMETQTSQDIPYGVEHMREDNESSESLNSPVSSPVDHQHSLLLANALRSSADSDAKDYGVSPYPKYASSPRPNNSYMFKREPPEGAESVKPFKEQDTQQLQQRVISSCPDVKKNNFNKSTLSAFTPLPPKLVMQALSVVLGPDQASSNSLHVPMSTNILVNTNNNSNNNSAPGSNTHFNPISGGGANSLHTFSPIPFVNSTLPVANGDA